MNWGIDTVPSCDFLVNSARISTHTNANTNADDMSAIDKAWFQEKIAARKLSQRKLAKVLEIDPSSMTVMLNGKRKMTMGEAQTIAGQLALPVTEIMRRAGIDVRDDIKKVAIGGFVNAEAWVTLLPRGTHDMIEAPADVPSTGFALQVRHAGGPHDGWLLFVDGAQREPKEMIGKACIVALSDGRLVSAMPLRGYKAGTYNLVIQPHAQVLENQSVAWCSPVLWIKPQ